LRWNTRHEWQRMWGKAFGEDSYTNSETQWWKVSA
jgi:hypothetical protein